MSKLTILYDGACVVCNKEVMHYLKFDKSKKIVPVDISAPSFRADIYGLTDDAVNLHMHAIDDAGKVFIGVETFIQIWKRIPKYKWLIPIFENRLLRPSIDFGYDVFARHIRPRLPKRDCENGTCSY